MRFERLIEDFARQADGCADCAEIVATLDDFSGDMGISGVAITFSEDLRLTSPLFRHHDTYPPSFDEVFVRHGFFRIDPILHAAQRRIGGFAWDKVGEIISLSAAQKEILLAARREGLCNGYTIPANVPGEPLGSVNFATSRSEPIPMNICRCLDCVGRIAFEATRRVRGLSAMRNPLPKLNNRQIQCLDRLARGSTDKEIARALAISPETVGQYIKMARSAYRVRTRTQLVAAALRDSRIAFSDGQFPELEE